MAYIALEKLHQLYDGYVKPIRVGGKGYVLIQEEGQRYLIENSCPHMGAPLHKGIVSQQILRCPSHGMEFNLRTGQALGGAAQCTAALKKIPLIYDGNTIGIDTAE